MNRIIMLVGSACQLCMAGCYSTTRKEAPDATYKVTAPLRLDTSLVKEYVSQIKSIRNIEIRAQEKGYLQDIYVDEGQFVKAGQILFRIMPKAYEAELFKAKAEAKAAEIERENTRTLSEKNIVSKNELAMAQAKVDQAKAEVALASLHLSFTEIRAPFDGTIDRIPLKRGSLVEEGELLTSLSDNRQMFAYFNVSEPEYLDYQMNTSNRANQHIGLLLANNQPFPYEGRVETIESEFNNETGNIAFRARFPNPERLLKNGETGKVRMTVPVTGALIIPQKATYEIQEKTYVFVVDRKGVIQARNIAISHTLPDLYVIGNGLTEKDRILLEGIQKVKEGDKIHAEFVKPKQVVDQLRLYAE